MLINYTPKGGQNAIMTYDVAIEVITKQALGAWVEDVDGY